MGNQISDLFENLKDVLPYWKKDEEEIDLLVNYGRSKINIPLKLFCGKAKIASLYHYEWLIDLLDKFNKKYSDIPLEVYKEQNHDYFNEQQTGIELLIDLNNKKVKNFMLVLLGNSAILYDPSDYNILRETLTEALSCIKDELKIHEDDYEMKIDKMIGWTIENYEWLEGHAKEKKSTSSILPYLHISHEFNVQIQNKADFSQLDRNIIPEMNDSGFGELKIKTNKYSDL